MSEPTNRPTRKVSAATVGGAVAAIAAWLVQLGAGVDMPPGVEAAVATLVAAAAGWATTDDPT